MTSLLAIALFAHAVAAKPVDRRQVGTTVTGTITASFPVITTVPSDNYTFTETLAYTDSLTTDLYSSEYPTDTSSEYPSPTGGSDDGSYWICSFPPTGAQPTTAYTSDVTVTYLSPTATATATATATVITESVSFDTSSFSESFATDSVVTATETDTATDTVTLTIPTATESLTATEPDVTSFVTATEVVTTDIDETFTGSPTATEFPTWTDTLISISVPTAAPGGVSTYTVIGPETTAIIECVRFLPWHGHGQHHPHPPSPQPTWTRTWSVETAYPTGTFPTGTFPITDSPDTTVIWLPTGTATATATTTATRSI